MLLLAVHRGHHGHILPKQFRGTGVVVLLPVQGGNLGHLLVGEGKVEEGEVVPDVAGVLRAGDHNVAVLDVPAEDNLGAGLAVLLAQLGKEGLLQQGFVPVAQGVPGLEDDALVLQEPFEVLLLGVGVGLGLQHGGLHLAEGEDLLDLGLAEVGQADGPHLPLLVGCLHLAVTGHIVAGGLVDEEEVNIVRTQPGQGFVHCVGLLVKAGPQLGLQEDLLPLQAGPLHGPAHGLLVEVGVGGVDEAVPILQGVENGGLRLVRGEEEGADARHGHFDAVV